MATRGNKTSYKTVEIFISKMMKLAKKSKIVKSINLLNEVVIGKKGCFTYSETKFSVTLSNGKKLKYSGGQLKFNLTNNFFSKSALNSVKADPRNKNGKNAHKGTAAFIEKLWKIVKSKEGYNVLSIELVKPFISDETNLDNAYKSIYKVVYDNGDETEKTGQSIYADFNKGEFYKKRTRTVTKVKSEKDSSSKEMDKFVEKAILEAKSNGRDVSSIVINNGLIPKKGIWSISYKDNGVEFIQTLDSFKKGVVPKIKEKTSSTYVVEGTDTETGETVIKRGRSNKHIHRIKKELPKEFNFIPTKLLLVFDNNANGVWTNHEIILDNYLTKKAVKIDKQHLSGTKSKINGLISKEFSNKRMKKYILKYAKKHSDSIVFCDL